MPNLRQLFFAHSLLLLMLGNGCTTQEVVTPPAFKSFEISYHGGWIGYFSLLVDSNKQYTTYCGLSNTCSGVLPDSIFNQIDETYLNILSDSSMHHKGERCDDCSRLALEIVRKTDTILIVQEGDLHPKFMSTIKLLQTFLNSAKHSDTSGLFLMKTATLIATPPLLPKH